MSSLLEIVPEVYVGVGPSLRSDAVVVVVVLMDLSGVHPVVHSLFNCFFWLRVGSSDHNVDEYVLLVVDDFEALLNSRVQVDIPGCATVHKEVLAGVLRLEHNWNGARC